MRNFFLLICCGLSAEASYAIQTCKLDSIPASTPDSQLTDNIDGTVTDLKTGLMWKKCLEGVGGESCETGSPISFTWQEALEQPIIINNGGGFAGYTDWRMPNIRELISIVEEQCYNPAINLNRFPNMQNLYVWSGSPYNGGAEAWHVNFVDGESHANGRDRYPLAVRLVRGGQ